MGDVRNRITSGIQVSLCEDSSPLLDSSSSPPARCGLMRYVVVGLLAGGFFFDYLLRVNISFALDGGMSKHNISDVHDTGKYAWSQQMQGFILGSFFWGYCTTQLPGALIAKYLGPRNIFGSGLLLATLATLLSPLVASFGPWYLMSLRIFIGMGQGVTFPVALLIITRWIPETEKGLCTSLASGAGYLGAVVASVLSGYLCRHSFLGGWPSVFYLYGIFGVVWCLAWFMFVSDGPDCNRWVSTNEAAYITAAVSLPKKVNTSIPWCSILTSVPVISLCVTHACKGFGYFMLLSETPKFMVEVLGFDIQNSGLLTALPSVTIYCGYLLSGKINDHLIKHNLLTITWVRKYAIIVGLVIPAVLLTTLSFVENRIYVLILMNMAMFFNGFSTTGYYLNYMDLSPKHSSILCGFGNSFAAAGGFVGPIFVGYLISTVDEKDPHYHFEIHIKWKLAFFTASIVWVFGAAQYCIFGSGEEQPWSKTVKREVSSSEQI